MTFSADGRTIYGIVGPNGGPRRLSAITINPSRLTRLPHSDEFNNYFNSLTVDTAGDKTVISAMYGQSAVQQCGLFELDITMGTIEKIIDNLGSGCDYLSSWSDLSISPDGTRVVGTARKGQVGVVNLKEHRVEKLWAGTAASWSPDGKWIAALSFAEQMEIELIRTSDLSLQRRLGSDETGRVDWSPDSRYLLVFSNGFCGLGTGYVGSLQTLDIETGQRLTIESSKCRVNLMSTGWVSDDVLK